MSKLPQRAGFVTEKLFKTYGLLVYLEETSLLKKPIKQIEDELKAKNAKVECKAFGFAARFSTLLSFLQGLVDIEIHAYHRVLFMQENVAFKFQILTDSERETVFIEAVWLQPKKKYAH